MAAVSFIYFIMLLFLNYVYADIVNITSPEVNKTDENDTRAHLKFKNVVKLCNNKDEACSSSDIIVCTLRKLKNHTEYRDFNNSCYLFFSNMCDYPGEEFSIVQGGTCADYFKSRRNEGNAQTEDKIVNNNENANSSVTDKPKTLRAKRREEPLDETWDYNKCPKSCTNAYHPVCINVNKGEGKWAKLFTFMNQCLGYKYYCEHWREFRPPPGTNLYDIEVSDLVMRFCASNRYNSFAVFSEMASSLGHFGWLAGDYSYKHIMAPHERKPGYG